MNKIFFQFVEESREIIQDIQKPAKVMEMSETISKPVFKVTIADCVCKKLKTPLVHPLNESCGTDSGFVDAVDKSIGNKKASVSFPNELDDEHELNGCQMWGNNWRQFTSVLPGILLLFTIGLHHVFTVYELDYFTTEKPGQLKATFSDRSAFDPVGTYFSSGGFSRDSDADGALENDSINQSATRKSKSTEVVMVWYLGAIAGGLLGASLIRNLKKRSIYVSVRRIIFQSQFSLHFFWFSIPVCGSIFTNFCRPLLLRMGK